MKAEWTNRDSLSIETTGLNSKAILVIDMPDICYKCPCYDHEGGICQATSNWKADREDGCPLRPMPSKLVPFGYLDAGNEDGLYEKGYNDCIDEITGEIE